MTYQGQNNIIFEELRTRVGQPTHYEYQLVI